MKKRPASDARARADIRARQQNRAVAQRRILRDDRTRADPDIFAALDACRDDSRRMLMVARRQPRREEPENTREGGAHVRHRQ